jgi:hypothetical protein
MRYDGADMVDYLPDSAPTPRRAVFYWLTFSYARIASSMVLLANKSLSGFASAVCITRSRQSALQISPIQYTDLSNPFTSLQSLLAIMAMTSKIKTTRSAEIHIGERTHHHDQSMNPVSLSVMNTIVSNPVNPIPPLRLLLCVLLISVVHLPSIAL